MDTIYNADSVRLTVESWIKVGEMGNKAIYDITKKDLPRKKKKKFRKLAYGK